MLEAWRNRRSEAREHKRSAEEEFRIKANTLLITSLSVEQLEEQTGRRYLVANNSKGEPKEIVGDFTEDLRRENRGLVAIAVLAGADAIINYEVFQRHGQYERGRLAYLVQNDA